MHLYDSGVTPPLFLYGLIKLLKIFISEKKCQKKQYQLN
jgi:hypothetical protein